MHLIFWHCQVALQKSCTNLNFYQQYFTVLICISLLMQLSIFLCAYSFLCVCELFIYFPEFFIGLFIIWSLNYKSFLYFIYPVRKKTAAPTRWQIRTGLHLVLRSRCSLQINNLREHHHQNRLFCACDTQNVITR